MQKYDKEYKMTIEPAILKLLGPNLYTNIYYILGELIANAYDADARNVYIFIENSKIIVEDDGNGMKYPSEIEKYLTVALESRKNEKESFSPLFKRAKMGRKGVGKLSALSISDKVKVMTIKNGEKSGFIMTTHPNNDGLLEPILDEDIVFNKIKENGTSIIMEEPKYSLNKKLSTIASNIARIFPIINEEFKIYLIQNNEEKIITNFESEILDNQLAAIITLGEKFKHYSNKIEFKENIISNSDSKNIYNTKTKNNEIDLLIKNNQSNIVNKKLIINGWIGAYKNTRNRKKDVMDFQDNFLSIYANGKMGEFNILPRIGQNKLYEVYIVGQIHVNLFEDSDLPDIALSNRQGYKTDDIRYEKLEEYLRILLNDIINLRGKWADTNNIDKIKKKEELQLKKENELKEKINTFKSTIQANIIKTFDKNSYFVDRNEEIISEIMNDINIDMKILGIKSEIDVNKKKILLSHAHDDKFYADLIYEMLKFNRIPSNDFIYSSSDDEEARIGENKIYEYLRNFFVDSYSNEKIHVIYVTSSNLNGAWGAIAEIGAGWITKSDSDIFNVNDYHPSSPLNIESTYIQVNINKNIVSFKTNEIDEFCKKIEKISSKLGYSPRTREENKKQLEKYGIEISNIKVEIKEKFLINDTLKSN